METRGIYKITNTLNGKVYIGQSKNISRRITCHKSELKRGKHHNLHLQRSYSNNPDSFKFEVILYCCIGLVDNLERYYIDKYKSMDSEFGYNKESGGHLNKVMSEESCKKISLAGKGRITSEETKEKLRISSSGKRHSEKSLEKMSQIGKNMSDEHKLKISAAKKGKPFSNEHKIKLSISRKDRVISEETKALVSLNSKKSKKVINTITSEIFSSAAVAAKAVNMNYNTLVSHLNGTSKNKTPLKYL